jgi:peptidoglycan/LPS O-acetylase OafA/YrhL
MPPSTLNYGCQRRLPEIDGLRAVAMTAVVAQHCGLAPCGWVGVWLFFVISGFVIARNFEKDEYAGRSLSGRYRAFMTRRFFRIVPVYILYLAIGTLLILPTGKLFELRDIPFLITFTHNWQMIFNIWPNPDGWSGFGHLWTLSIEEQFYIVFPLLFLTLPRRYYSAFVITLIAAGPLIRYAYSTALAGTTADGGWIAFAVYAASFAHFDAFLIGALIAHFEEPIRNRGWISVVLGGVAITLAAMYAICYVYVNHAMGASGVDLLRNIFSGVLFGQGREIVVYTVVNLLAATAVVCALMQKPFLRVLAGPTISLVGMVSYGGYLYHALVLWLISTFLARPSTVAVPERLALFALTWSLTIFVAYLSFRWFESPILSWAKRPHVVSKSQSTFAADPARPPVPV